MDFNLISSMLVLTMIYASPILITSLGGLLSERSGIVNVALEGIMMVGGFTAGTFVIILAPHLDDWLTPIVTLFIATAVGMIFSLIHAFVSVDLKGDQVISGTALNLLAGGLTIFFAQVIFGQQRTEPFAEGFTKMTFQGLSDIPVIGRIFFTNIYYTVYIGFALVLLVWFAVYKTVFGTRLRACGENPHAAASNGISVRKMRYMGVMLSGALGGLGGAVMILTQGNQYTSSSIHGTGFIALAALIFGKWNPFGVLGASMFFAFSQVLAIYATDISFLQGLPHEVFSALPYVLTVIALVIFSGKSVGPKAVGEVYDVGKR